ncbi:MAG: hypothetical protein ACRD4O_10670, partial [Bryobacteraceae bacterium]
RTRLCAASARELKRNGLLRSTTVQDAADIASRMAAHMEYGETSRQTGAVPTEQLPQVSSQEAAEDIFSQMSAYMIAQ